MKKLSKAKKLSLILHAKRSLRHRIRRADHNRGLEIHEANVEAYKRNHPVRAAVRNSKKKAGK